MRLRNAPLVQVLAQVVYAPVLNWKEHVPKFQERLIELGFPRVNKQESAEIRVEFGGPGQPTEGAARHGGLVGPSSVQQQVITHYEFADRAQQTAFVLGESAFVLHTSDYQSKEPFFALLERGLEILNACMRVTLVERIGLRYIDLVQPGSGERFGQYVHAGLLGYPFAEAPKLKAARRGFATQSVATTPDGSLAIRSAVVPPGQYLPPDLNPGSLRRPTNIDVKSAGLVIDFDHFTIFNEPGRAMDFAPVSVVEHLTALHATLREAFEVCVTDYARQKWGPWEEVSAK